MEGERICWVYMSRNSWPQSKEHDYTKVGGAYVRVVDDDPALGSLFVALLVSISKCLILPRIRPLSRNRVSQNVNIHGDFLRNTAIKERSYITINPLQSTFLFFSSH
jgi:hypothetical protein